MRTPEDRTRLVNDLLAAGFVESVFHCPACGLGGTTLSRPALLEGKTCAGCAEPVVVSVVERFSRGS